MSITCERLVGEFWNLALEFHPNETKIQFVNWIQRTWQDQWCMNWGQFKDVLCYLFFNGCVVTLWSAKGGCKLKYQIILSIATFQSIQRSHSAKAQLSSSRVSWLKKSSSQQLMNNYTDLNIDSYTFWKWPTGSLSSHLLQFLQIYTCSCSPP